MGTRWARGAGALALVLAIVGSGQVTVGQSALPEGQDAQVVSIVDGDTIRVRLNGKIVAVRYIGVDAPELRGSTQLRCFSREARLANTKLVTRQTVRLERDVNETDRFGRLLRYVYLPDGRLVNEVLAQEGFVTAAAFPPDIRYQERLSTAARAAQESGIGLWAKCRTSTTSAAVTPSATPAPVAVSEAQPASAAAEPTALPQAPAPTAMPAAASASSAPGRWPNSVQPVSEWECPESHPFKGNANSMIYHPPGGRYYAKTKPEGCFATAEDAVAAGFRAPKR
jgi:micrococcal nuclease